MDTVHHLLYFLMFASMVVSIYGDCPRNVDPCNSTVYKEMDDPTRSTGYYASGTRQENDYGLRTEWYRSVSAAGGDMPTSPVYTRQCNSFAPIWLNGPLPTESDGIKDIQACASFTNNTCKRQYTVAVMNCGDFNVYCLRHTESGFDRYCMGSEVACPSGYTSPTGFTPGCYDPSKPEDVSVGNEEMETTSTEPIKEETRQASTDNRLLIAAVVVVAAVVVIIVVVVLVLLRLRKKTDNEKTKAAMRENHQKESLENGYASLHSTGSATTNGAPRSPSTVTAPGDHEHPFDSMQEYLYALPPRPVNDAVRGSRVASSARKD